MWYWNLVTQEGKIICKKVTTEQIRTLIKAGHLSDDAQISKSKSTGFRGAATFPEFQPHFTSREAQTQANVKGKGFRDQMRAIAEEDAQQRKWAGFSRFWKSAGGTLMGIFWIVLVLAVLGVGGYFLVTKVLMAQ